ncbi:LCP family protein [Hathewaya limosa]|uniref:LCP family protein required for cell wall assembly n=1 Tax=Hathewaya limosa TaxID=1536 RepID=A0ABU0JQX6_HATLI|nr:LCP family protein [Hathewaya limosa]MDQ0479497.1 LCP family protein required for cell wall assembly [Hathewaya limosa]
MSKEKKNSSKNRKKTKLSEKKNDSSKKYKKKKKRHFFRNIFVIFLVLICSFLAYAMHHLGKLNNNAVELNSTKPKNEEFINILAMGVDIGDPDNPNDPKRTDTMILINYNLKKHKLNLVSIPRDTKVDINGRTQKINVAHALGGPKMTVEKVEELLDIHIDYYAKVDYSGFRGLIDAIGGIDMEIMTNMKYDDDAQDLHIDFKKGQKEHLDGAKAEQFFRWRKNNDGTGLAEGDIGRIKNQHEFLQEVFKKVKSPTIIPRLPKIVSTIPKCVETNMSAGDIISYSLKLMRVKKNDISIRTLGGEGRYINRISYFVYSEKLSSDVLSSIKNSDYISINKDQIKINILNQTKKAGLAKDLQKYIEEKGYKNITSGNKTGENKTKIIFNGLNKDVANVIKEDFKITNVEYNDEKKDGDYDVVVLLGYDHDYINE